MPGEDIVRTSPGGLLLTFAENREELFGDGAATQGANGLDAVKDGQTLGFDLLKGIHGYLLIM
jgi:hypothetical protein